ncbi:MAG: hypothetical protein ABJN14_18240 [Paracoccaceae bacterium]
MLETTLTARNEARQKNLVVRAYGFEPNPRAELLSFRRKFVVDKEIESDGGNGIGAQIARAKRPFFGRASSGG